MNIAQEKYNLYKKFLKQFKDYYSLSFLTNLIRWTKKPIFFSPKQIRAYWEEFLDLNKDYTNNINFYLHIPFCRSKCSYCLYYSRTSTEQEIEEYLNNLIEEIYFFKPTFSNIEFTTLYIGGGTPSILSQKQMEELFINLFAVFKFKKKGEKTFECNPSSTTLEKLKTLKRFGFNRVSLGVQNLDKKVLKFANRAYENYDLIRKVVKNAKKLNFEVNTDLMIGLKGDSIKSIMKSFIALTKLQPDTITLYSFQPSEEYVKKHFHNNYYTFNTNLEKKARKIYQRLNSMKNVLNYVNLEEEKFEIYTSVSIGHAYISKNFKPTYEDYYGFTAPITYAKPCSLFGLGTASNSYIFSALQYNDAALGREVADFNQREKKYWAMIFNLKDEMRYFILQHLSHKTCFSQKEFKTFFKSSFKTNFRTAIKNLKSINKIKIKGDLVFLPTDPLERYTTVLFLFNEKDVSKKIKEV